MKKLIFLLISVAILLSIFNATTEFRSGAAVIINPVKSTNYFDIVQLNELRMSIPTLTGMTNVIQTSLNPILSLDALVGWNPITSYSAANNGVFRYGSFGYNTNGFSFTDVVNMDTNLVIFGNISCYGTISAFASILWQTNTITYPTNSQTAEIDLTIPYGDLEINSPVSLSVRNQSAISYQKAVVLIHNITGMSTSILTPGFTSIVGLPYVTNNTVATIFYNPKYSITNITFENSN